MRARDAAVIRFATNAGRVANLTLHQAGGRRSFAVDIAQGRLDLDGCDISSDGLTGIAVHDRADPRLRRNRIHNSAKNGVVFYSNGLGTLEDNEIAGNTSSGIQIKTGSDPVISGNRIHDNRGAGLLVEQSARGTATENDITENRRAGIEIASGGHPVARHNRINGNRRAAIMIYGSAADDGGADSGGVFEGNDLTDNACGPWDVAAECAGTVRRARNKEK